LEVHSFSDFAVSEINKLTEPYRKLCGKLSLKSILRAEQLLPEKGMLGFKKTTDYVGFKADLSDDTAVINVVFQIWIYTKPVMGYSKLLLIPKMSELPNYLYLMSAN
jgi:hypothetical protein